MDAAHVHLILNHIPVLGAVATLCLVVLADFKKDAGFTKLTLQFMILIGVLTLPVFFTGEPAEEIVEHLPGVTESLISDHERFANFAFALTEIVGAIGLLGLYWSRKNPDSVKKYWRFIQVVAIANAVLMLATANLGGQIRHTEIRKAGAALPTSEIQSPAREHDD